ncbi:MAG: hypothetical protein HYY16_02580, partial [Planctomycetes bacterium]|nr:hypothetical protein [Planctomycetota bacterium]
GPERVLEIFAEVYAQVGRIGPHVEKRSWALHAGARVAYESGLWAEAGLAYRSGDRSPGDGHDQAFQSAERVDRFLIVESAEFGLDWDTNVRSLQFGFGLPVSAPLSFRLDAGSFWFNQDLRDPTGARWMGETHDRIGLEIDGTVSYAIDRRVRATLRAGMLVGSEVLDALTVEGHEESWMVAAGVEGGF